MSDATGMEARTIHRLIEVDPATGSFKRNADNPIDCDLLVVDEASMVDVMLMRALLAAIPGRAALLIVGDTDQLPSVGPGQVLADMIASKTVPVVRLTEVFRQAAQSRIVTTAHGINRGAIPDLSRQDRNSDFHFVQAEDPETAAARIVELVKTRIPKGFGLDPVRDIQVPCPMNRGAAGARALNVQLQAALNPSRGRKVERFGWTFAAGDKVMQTVNDYRRDVYNGDTGEVADVDPETGELTARFHGEDHVYAFGELDALIPAYAATVHKSQGSEYPAVVIPMLTQHYVMLQRNLLYTALTRGKRLVVLVGQKKAVAIALRNPAGRRRWSKLDEWLRAPAERKTEVWFHSNSGRENRVTLADEGQGDRAREPQNTRIPARTANNKRIPAETHRIGQPPVKQATEGAPMRRSITTKTGSQVELTDAQLEVMARRLQQKAWALHSECEPNGEDAKVLARGSCTRWTEHGPPRRHGSCAQEHVQPNCQKAVGTDSRGQPRRPSSVTRSRPRLTAGRPRRTKVPALQMETGRHSNPGRERKHRNPGGTASIREDSQEESLSPVATPGRRRDSDGMQPGLFVRDAAAT